MEPCSTSSCSLSGASDAHGTCKGGDARTCQAKRPRSLLNVHRTFVISDTPRRGENPVSACQRNVCLLCTVPPRGRCPTQHSFRPQSRNRPQTSSPVYSRPVYSWYILGGQLTGERARAISSVVGSCSDGGPGAPRCRTPVLRCVGPLVSPPVLRARRSEHAAQSKSEHGAGARSRPLLGLEVHLVRVRARARVRVRARARVRVRVRGSARPRGRAAW